MFDRSSPSLNEYPWYHYIISRFSSVYQLIFKDNYCWTRNNSRLQSFVYFLYLYFLIVLVLSSTMNGQKVSSVALPNLHALRHESSLSLLFPHGHKHVKERIWFLLNFSTTDRRQQKFVKLVYIWGCPVNFSTISASKILLCLSIFDVACSDSSALNDHKFVDMTLSEVPKSVEVYLFQGRHIHQSHINMLLCWQ